jgi:DNA-binding transcriptional MocR family regulator
VLVIENYSRHDLGAIYTLPSVQYNMDDYRKIAAQIAEDVASGRLQPGDRLPPQRRFAYERGIAPSTAGRVYADLVRRGIATGEVGRGTFVRAEAPQLKPALAEPPSARIDMETNYPVLPEQHRLLAPALAVLASRPDALNASMCATNVQGSAPVRAATATALASQSWDPAPESLLFAGNGRQALAAAFSALAPVGERIGFEALTYPVARAIAARLGIDAVPLAMDADGLRPDAVERAHQAAPLRAIYLQPTLQNPLGTTMPAQRRADLAELLKRLQGPIAVEDRVYAFLEKTAPPPLAAFAPDHVVVVDSLSKRISPGLTLGFLCAPEQLVARLAKALISGAWMAQGFSMDIGVRWLSDGTVTALEAAKRADALMRQSIAMETLKGLNIRANPAAYHLLLDLPAPWRADAYVLAAERQGIAITPASAFAVSPGHAPNAVRFALAAPTLDELATSLCALAALARSKIEPAF